MNRKAKWTAAAVAAMMMALCAVGLQYDILLLTPYRGGELLPSDDVVRQKDSLSCGVAVLRMFAAGQEVNEVEAILRRLRPTEDGLSIQELYGAAREVGIAVERWHVMPGDLERLPTPAIGLVQARHFVLVEGIDEDAGFAIVVDPTLGRLKISLRRLQRLWTGPTLLKAPVTNEW